MDAMAAMFARMIGMKPEEMQAHFTNMQAMVMGTAEKVAAIHTNSEALITRIAELDERIKDAIGNGNVNNGNSNGSGGRGRRTGGGGSGTTGKPS